MSLRLTENYYFLVISNIYLLIKIKKERIFHCFLIVAVHLIFVINMACRFFFLGLCGCRVWIDLLRLAIVVKRSGG